MLPIDAGGLTRLTYYVGHYKIVCNIIWTRLYETQYFPTRRAARRDARPRQPSLLCALRRKQPHDAHFRTVPGKTRGDISAVPRSRRALGAWLPGGRRSGLHLGNGFRHALADAQADRKKGTRGASARSGRRAAGPCFPHSQGPGASQADAADAGPILLLPEHALGGAVRSQGSASPFRAHGRSNGIGGGLDQRDGARQKAPTQRGKWNEER